MLIFDLYFNKKISRLGDLFWFLVFCFWFLVSERKMGTYVSSMTIDYCRLRQPETIDHSPFTIHLMFPSRKEYRQLLEGFFAF